MNQQFTPPPPTAYLHGSVSRRIAVLMLSFLFFVGPARAFDFSAVAPSGQTLYYSVYNGEARLVDPDRLGVGWPSGYPKPTGALVIPDSVTHDGITYAVVGIEATFEGCDSLTSVHIPATVTTVYPSTLYNVPALSVAAGNPVYDSRNNCNAVIETATNTLVRGCANTVIPNSVTAIGHYAFYNCQSLTTFSVPPSVRSVGMYAFYGCSNLVSIHLGDSVSTVGMDVFWGCNSLTTLTLGNALTTIPLGLCGNSTPALTTVVLGNAVDTINISAFSRCYNLRNITLPGTVRYIGANAFYGCKSLPSLTVPSAVDSIGSMAFYNVRMVYYGGSAVSHDSENVYEDLYNIGSNWGALCLNGYVEDSLYYTSTAKDTLAANHPDIHSITIPASVSHIGPWALSGREHLQRILQIPATVSSIGRNAFENVCMVFYNGMAVDTLPDSDGKWGARCLNGYIEDSIYYTSAAKDILVGMHPDITVANIPSTVTSVVDWYNHHYYNYIVYDALNTVNFNAANFSLYPMFFDFYTTPNIVALHIGDSVRSFSANVFYRCSSLETITVSSGNAVYASPDGCNAVVKAGSDGDTLVMGCKNSVIPATVSVIEFSAFNYCTGLTAIDIPASVTDLRTAFRGCSNLRSVTLRPHTPPAGNYGIPAFEGCSPDLVFRVPCGTAEAYAAAAYAGCGTIQEANLDIALDLEVNRPLLGTARVLADNCDSTVIAAECTMVNGQAVSRFVGWSDGNTDNPRVIILSADTAFTALFEAVLQCTVSVASNDDAMGSVSGGGTYLYGDTVVLTATPTDSNYRFVSWGTDTVNPLVFIVTGDTTLTAYFEGSVGIPAVDGDHGFIVRHVADGIVVEGAEGERVVVYDAVGRQQSATVARGQAIPLPRNGLYLLRVGSRPAVKVVVVR